MSGNTSTGASTPKKASSACTACQARKSKCTGGIPCDKCQARNTDCIVDQDTDGRRKVALKRKQQEWEGDRILLDGILKTMRARDESHLQHVVQVVRSSASLEYIRTCVEEQVLQIDNNSTSPRASSEQYGNLPSEEPKRLIEDSPRRLMDMNRLVDDPPYKVPAFPWTNVTSDDHIVSHLVSLWFTWSSPLLAWVDRSLFLEDMCRPDNENALYCSAFLVNAMLAHACPYSNYAAVKSTRGRPSQMMLHFLAEAKHLLDEEMGRASLPTLQGLGILCICVSSLGRDRLGWIYARQMSDMASQLVNAQSKLHAGNTDILAGTSNVLRRTCWTLWMTTTTSCFIWQIPLLMDQPTCELPILPSHHEIIDQWSAYPVDQLELPPASRHSACLFELYHMLMPIIRDWLNVFSSTPSQTPVAIASAAFKDTYERLAVWYQAFPVCLALSDLAPFHVLAPHIYYRYLIIVLCLLSDDFPDLESQNSRNHISISEQNTLSICLEAALAIAQLLEAYRYRWGSRCDSISMHWAAVASYSLLFSDISNPTYAAAFSSLCRHIRSSSQRWPLGRGILRMLQITIARRARTVPSFELPADLEQLFQEFETQTWRGNLPVGQPVDVLKEFSSCYPNIFEVMRGCQSDRRGYEQMSSKDPPIIEMDLFLHKYEPS